MQKRLSGGLDRVRMGDWESGFQAMKVLAVEDDQEVLEYVENGLQELGWTIDTASNGKDGLFLAMNQQYDVIVLDRMLPEVNGIKVLKAIRSCDDQTPVLILSALEQVEQRVEGLNAGGDDYLAKPFAFSELQARLMALSKRSNWT